MNVMDAWIKAAVEHKILEITYNSRRTKNETLVREVEPDFIGTARDGKHSGMYATFCHYRNEGPRCFQPDSILKWKPTEKTFEPSPHGRWKELAPLYESKGLKGKPFEEAI